MRWMPNLTAPKDGTPILGHWDDGSPRGFYGIVAFEDGQWLDANGFDTSPPTNWQWLPDPPKPEGQ